jgi:PTH1 family peptidyl-tRNA hydrolase
LSLFVVFHNFWVIINGRILFLIQFWNVYFWAMQKFLIVGLGNIGTEYANTRHNIGFNVIDKMAQVLKLDFKLEKLALYAHTNYKGKQIHLIKPTTYMNLSGKAILYWMNFLNISIENIIIVLDDLALPFGTLRLRAKGSDAGHNGLKSIQTELKTQEYVRLKFGIGNQFPKGKQVEYVLGKWNNNEINILDERIKVATDIIFSYCTAGLQNTMNLYNNK